MQQIAGQFTGSDRQRYTAAADTFRIPYWDFAASPPNSGPVLPDSVSSSADVQVNSPTGPRTIPNPLFQYSFHPLSTTDFPETPISLWSKTVRYPTDESPSAQSRNNLVEQQLQNNRLANRDRVYNLFTAYTNYTEFASKAWFPADGGNYDSIESVHDQIHGLVGNGGHMGYIDYSAFDPIFYLHHVMVDRIFAMWQALHPNSFVQAEVTQLGTFTDRAGSVEDLNTREGKIFLFLFFYFILFFGFPPIRTDFFFFFFFFFSSDPLPFRQWWSVLDVGRCSVRQELRLHLSRIGRLDRLDRSVTDQPSRRHQSIVR